MKPLRRLLEQLEEIEVKESVQHNKFKKPVNEEDIKTEPVSMKDLEEAVKTTKKSPGLITQRYLKWVEDFGSV